MRGARTITRGLLMTLIETAIRDAQADPTFTLSDADAQALREAGRTIERCAVGDFNSCPAQQAGLYQRDPHGREQLPAGVGRFALAFDAAAHDELGWTTELVIE